MPPDPHSRHIHLHVCERALAHYYHPATTMFFLPPTQNPVYMKPCVVILKTSYVTTSLLLYGRTTTLTTSNQVVPADIKLNHDVMQTAIMQWQIKVL